MAMIGGLYFKSDIGSDAPEPKFINEDIPNPPAGVFAMGPSTSKMSIENGRAEVEFDRGPCK